MKKRILVLLMTLGALGAAAPQASAVGFFTPNYMASVDGYAPADYDGDGKDDFAIKDFSGSWAIDYASNGFGAYDVVYNGYGGQHNLPVPADYDGDGMDDLSVKSNTDGTWLIDYAYNGYGVWDVVYYGYGYAENRPVPADYDGDGMVDFAVKSSTQYKWNIDYASNGFGFWDASYNGYGGAENIPVPADYDGDRRADLAVWAASGPNAGTFNIDYARNGYGTWDRSFLRFYTGPGRPVAGDSDLDGWAEFTVKRDNGSWIVDYTCIFGCSLGTLSGHGSLDATYYGYGGVYHRPVNADYDGDGRVDLAIRAEVNPTSFSIDYASNGFGTWDATYYP